MSKIAKLLASSALSRNVELQPAAGPGAKIFPVTHEQGQYIEEVRRYDGADVPCVVVDTVQSQANRKEDALFSAAQDGLIEIPDMVVDFSEVPDLPENPGEVSVWKVSHRSADASLRDSLHEGQEFPFSPLGRRFASANKKDDSVFLEFAPNCLLYGIWDSTGIKGGLGRKLTRLVDSEIIAINTRKGVHRGVRIDALSISSEIQIVKGGSNGWDLASADEAAAKKSKKKEAGPVDENAAAPRIAANPSAVNHSSVPYSSHGGVSCDRLELSIVIDVTGLNQLQFGSPARNQAGREWLLITALVAEEIALRHLNLRSRCILRVAKPAKWEVITHEGSSELEISLDELLEAHKAATAKLKEAGISFAKTKLLPQAKLAELYRKSQKIQLVKG